MDQQQGRREAPWKLLSFPYAGGNAASYRGLAERLGDGFEVITIEPPGRGRRAGEPLLTSIDALAADAYACCHPHLGRSYALFGHSMGASIACEVARRIVRSGAPRPLHLFVSGRQAPSIAEKHRRWDLPRDRFLTALHELGGCPREFTETPELVDYFEPILRADFQAVETAPARHGAPMPVPITVFIGDDDDVTHDDAWRWSAESSRETEVCRFPGDHFFILQHWEGIAGIIRDVVAGERRPAVAGARA